MQLETLKGIVPAVLATLGPQEAVYCEHGIMLYKDPTVGVGRKTIKSGGMFGALKRETVGGIPFFLAEFVGPGSVAFSRDGVGEIREIELAPGEVLDVAEGSLLCAENRIPYDMFYVSGTHRPGRMVGFWMDRLTGPGWVALHGFGNIISMSLAPGEKMTCDYGALLWKSASVQAKSLNLPFGGGLLGKLESYEVLELIGPGKVALQSVDPKKPHS
ncbi:MAG: AIM24 family protein [Euryarchaeota archaeon]|nr:AIM24 family protein [Euryarchaeota archaeon]MDE1835574.1 AIM24 family protein [Euryarchaeota archaeon]MDE1878922.1 AIM24 family protein [Euryarchaeota archaeon]MDE2043804.1 AIM24 family protein [Thermoplasmata archaeon]